MACGLNDDGGHMSGDWQLSETPCAGQQAWSRAGGFLFASQEWGRVLASLGASTSYAWNPQWELGTCVAVFRRFGLRVGVLGLPVAGGPFDALSSAELSRCAHEIADVLELPLLRVSRTSFDGLDPFTVAARPEAWISGLQDWQSRRSKRLHKDIAYAARASAGLRMVDGCGDPAMYHALYASTVASHGGRLRYDRAYFEALGQLACVSPRLQVFSAVNDAGNVCGFGVLALHGDVGYYLHGAVDTQAKGRGVTDLLLERMIDVAKVAGCTRFDLMASPWDQPGLIRFKQKWADTSALSVTSDYPRGAVGRCVAMAVRTRSRHERSAALHWLGQK